MATVVIVTLTLVVGVLLGNASRRIFQFFEEVRPVGMVELVDTLVVDLIQKYPHLVYVSDPDGNRFLINKWNGACAPIVWTEPTSRSFEKRITVAMMAVEQSIRLMWFKSDRSSKEAA